MQTDTPSTDAHAAYEAALAKAARLRPKGVSSPGHQIGYLKRRVAALEDHVARAHRGLRLVADLREASGSLRTIAAAWSRATGRDFRITERRLHRIWNEGRAPSAEHLAELQALLDRDALPDRAMRLAAYAERAAAGQSCFGDDPPTLGGQMRAALSLCHAQSHAMPNG